MQNPNLRSKIAKPVARRPKIKKNRSETIILVFRVLIDPGVRVVRTTAAVRFGVTTYRSLELTFAGSRGGDGCFLFLYLLFVLICCVFLLFYMFYFLYVSFVVCFLCSFLYLFRWQPGWGWL